MVPSVLAWNKASTVDTATVEGTLTSLRALEAAAVQTLQHERISFARELQSDNVEFPVCRFIRRGEW